MFYLFVILNLFLCFNLPAQPDHTEKKITYLDKIGVSEIHLKNGMRVIFKQTDFEKKEIHFRMCAKGGYAILPPSQHLSGKLATSMGWESGFGELSADQIAVLLYKHSIEFSPQIHPFYRSIDGCFHQEEIEMFVKLIQLFFTHHHIKDEAFNTVLKEAKEQFQKCPQSHSSSFTLDDFEKVDFQVVNTVLNEAFSSPSEFILTLVGDLDPEKFTMILTQFFDKMPAIESKTTQFSKQRVPDLDLKDSLTGMVSKTRSGSLIRFSYPMKLKVNEEQMEDLDFVRQLMYNHLNQSLKHLPGLRFCLETSIVFPFHPFLESPYLEILCRCDPCDVDNLKKGIHEGVSSFHKKQSTSKEIEDALKQLKKNNRVWAKENEYWIVTLSNYAIWNWDFQTILNRYEKPDVNKIETIKKFIFHHH